MIRKGTGFLLLAFSLAMGAGAAAAAPLPHAQGISNGSAVQQVREYRRYRTWRGCPYWYQRTFWGAYRLYSPCSKKVTEHAY